MQQHAWSRSAAKAVDAAVHAAVHAAVDAAVNAAADALRAAPEVAEDKQLESKDSDSEDTVTHATAGGD